MTGVFLGDRAMLIALEALDALGLALADHNHVWSERERQLYEMATSSFLCRMGIDSSASEIDRSLKLLSQRLQACDQALTP